MFSAKSVLHLWILTHLIFDCKINAYVVRNDEPIDHRKVLKMDAVTACQMNCFEEFLLDSDDEVVNPFWNIIDRCVENSNCYMCYDFCEMLNDESRMVGKLMCTNDACFTGCKYACVFHKLLPKEVLIDD